MKERLAAMSARQESSNAPKTDVDKAISPDVEEAIRPPATAKTAGPTPLPKVTLYAHANVLKAIRLLAVEDGVQAQEILRRSIKEYLATRGHHFTDLTTGK